MISLNSRIKVSRENGAQKANQKIHPAAIFVAIFLAVAVGRLPELLPVLKPLHLGRVTLVAALLSVIFNWKNSNRVFDSGLGKRIVAFTAIAIVSATYSIWGSRTLLFLQNDLLNIVLLFLLVYMTATNRKTFGVYLAVLAGTVAVISILSMLSSAGGRTSISQSYDPNDIGLVLLTASSMIFGICIDKSAPYRGILLVISFLGFSSVLATQSRGAFLGLCAVAIFFVLATRNVREQGYYRMPNLRVLLIVAAVVGIVLIMTPESSWDRILTIFELESDYNTSTERGRVAIWERGIQAFLHSPWGVGGGAFQAADMREGGSYITAHNSFLQVAVELGLVGILIYLSMFKQVWLVTRQLLIQEDQSVKKLTKELSPSAIALGFRASLIGFSVSGFFLSMGYGRILFTMFGLVAAYELICEKSRKSIESESADTSRHSGLKIRSRI